MSTHLNQHQKYFELFTVNFYRPQRSWGKVIFSEACVNNSVRGGRHAWLLPGGHAWLLRGGGACVVAPGGHVWLLQGAMHGCSGGVCMVAPGGCAWLLQGGMRGCSGGGHAWDTMTYGDTVNERAVRILLECILVITVIP